MFENVPGIDGIIMSPGTRESKLSISANKCGCERCQNSDDVAWYEKLISTMNAKLEPLGKRLIIRDFAFGASDQTVVLQGVNRTSSNIVMALKNTPHEFLPHLPHQPRHWESGHEEWIEFDTLGTVYRQRRIPAGIIEDMQARMKDCYDLGAKGIYLRSDWENMEDHCAFNSPNLLNTIAGAMLASNVDTDLEDIYREWAAYGLLSPMKPASFDQKPEPLKDRKTTPVCVIL